MSDHKTVYLDGLERVATLVLGLDADALQSPLPACPGWTVQDAVAHVTGILDDSLAGNLEGVGSDAWTRAQIEKRAGRPIAEVVDEWRALAAQAAPVFEENEGPLTASIIGDFTTHEHDLRGGLGNGEARDTESVHVALEWYARQTTKKFESAGAAPLRIVTPAGEWQRGDGDPGATVSGDAFTMLRALTGRRTRDEVDALDWEGDAASYAADFSFYGWPEASLGE